MKHHSKTILTSATGTGSVNLDGIPAAAVANAEVTAGQGAVVLEAMVTVSCRLMVTDGVLDGKVTVEWDQAA